MNLNGKQVLLTGASAGLGVFIAKELAARGAHLILAARTEKGLLEVQSSLTSLTTEVAVVPADLSNENDRINLIQSAIRHAGRIDVLVNNAGQEHVGPYDQQSWGSIRQMVEVNLAAPMHLTHLVLPHMLERDEGHIVNLSSIAGKVGAPYDAAYCGTKAGLIRWTQGLRLEYAGTGIRFSTVIPGYVTGVGMFARFGMKPQPIIGSCTPPQVARAVAEAIEKERPELVVNSRPLRPGFAIAELSPRIAEWLLHRLGIVDFQRKKST